MPTWLNALGICVVLIGFLGAAVVFLRGSRDKGTIETLERSNKALDERVKILESESLRDKATQARDRERIAALEHDKADLVAQRPSAETLADIRAELTSYVTEARHSHAEMRALLMAIAQHIEPREGE